jgi:hypothetical protein
MGAKVNSTGGIVLLLVCKSYLSYPKRIMTTKDPIKFTKSEKV